MLVEYAKSSKIPYLEHKREISVERAWEAWVQRWELRSKEQMESTRERGRKVKSPAGRARVSQGDKDEGPLKPLAVEHSVDHYSPRTIP